MQLKREFTYPRSSTETLVAALNELAATIQSGDGVANAVIAEAAMTIAEQKEQREYLEWCLGSVSKYTHTKPISIDQWREWRHASAKGLL